MQNRGVARRNHLQLQLAMPYMHACIWAVDRLLPFDDVDPRVGAVASVGRYVQRRPFALA